MTITTGYGGTLEYVEGAVRERIARYRGRAAEFRELAETEPIGRLRSQLLHLAAQYDTISETLKADRDVRTALVRNGQRQARHDVASGSDSRGDATTESSRSASVRLPERG